MATLNGGFRAIVLTTTSLEEVCQTEAKHASTTDHPRQCARQPCRCSWVGMPTHEGLARNPADLARGRVTRAGVVPTLGGYGLAPLGVTHSSSQMSSGRR